MFWRTFLLVTFAACALALPVRPIAAQTPVPNLDENRLAGDWFEIARLPDKAQKLCSADSIRLIARWDKPGSLEWVSACTVKAGYNNASTSYARAVPKRKKPGSAGNGEYKVYFFWPLAHKYDVLAIAPDSSWLLLGSTNHKELWIYSRTPTMPEEVLAPIRAQAASEGYPVDKLVLQPQSKSVSAGSGVMTQAKSTTADAAKEATDKP
jgi:apolipoprotein D and lipocalin family protein